MPRWLSTRASFKVQAWRDLPPGVQGDPWAVFRRRSHLNRSQTINFDGWGAAFQGWFRRFRREVPPPFDPNGTFITAWRPMIFGIVLFAVTMAPWELAFSWWRVPSWYKLMGKIFDIVLLVDMALNFNTSYIAHGLLVQSRRKIAAHYLKTFFVVDFLSNMPIDWFVATEEAKSRKLMKLAKIPKILRFVKLMRVVKDQTQYVGVISTLGVMALYAHYYTCYWAWTLLDSCFEDGSNCPDPADAYAEGLSVCFAALAGGDAYIRLTTGAGSSRLGSLRNADTELRTDEELVTAFMSLVGFILLACLFGNIAAAISSLSEVGRTRAIMLDRRKVEMREAGVPDDLQAKVRLTYERLWRFGGQKDGMLRDAVLSLDLRRNLALCIYGPALRKVPIFSKLPDIYLKCIAQRVELRLYTPGDLLVLYGEEGTELFVLHSGVARPLDAQGNPLSNVALCGGDFFGEICFLHPHSRRTASVLCIEFCRAMVLTIGIFQELNLEHLLDEIRNFARQRASLLQHASELPVSLPERHQEMADYVRKSFQPPPSPPSRQSSKSLVAGFFPGSSRNSTASSSGALSRDQSSVHHFQPVLPPNLQPVPEMMSQPGCVDDYDVEDEVAEFSGEDAPEQHVPAPDVNIVDLSSPRSEPPLRHERSENEQASSSTGGGLSIFANIAEEFRRRSRMSTTAEEDAARRSRRASTEEENRRRSCHSTEEDLDTTDNPNIVNTMMDWVLHAPTMQTLPVGASSSGPSHLPRQDTEEGLLLSEQQVQNVLEAVNRLQESILTSNQEFMARMDRMERTQEELSHQQTDFSRNLERRLLRGPGSFHH